MTGHLDDGFYSVYLVAEKMFVVTRQRDGEQHAGESVTGGSFKLC